MKKDILKKLIEDNTTDNGIDYDSIFESVNSSINDVIASKTKPEMEKLKSEAYDLAKQDFIKSLKLDGVTSENELKAHLNSLSSDSKSQDLIDIQNKYKELETQYEGVNSKASEYEVKVKEYENQNFLISKGANVKDIDYINFKVSKMVNDETPYEKAYETFAKENSQFFTPTAPKDNFNSGNFRQPNEGIRTDPIEAALIAKGHIKN